MDNVSSLNNGVLSCIVVYHMQQKALLNKFLKRVQVNLVEVCEIRFVLQMCLFGVVMPGQDGSQNVGDET